MAFIPCSPYRCINTHPTPKIVTQYPQNLGHINIPPPNTHHSTISTLVHSSAFVYPGRFVFFPTCICIHIRWIVLLDSTFYCNGVFSHRTGECISWLEYKQGKFDKNIILIHIDIHVILDQIYNLIQACYLSASRIISNLTFVHYVHSYRQYLFVFGMYLHMDSNLQDKLLLKENNGNGEMHTTY